MRQNDSPTSYTHQIYRTRLCIITPTDFDPMPFAPLLENVLDGQDVASLLILPPKMGDYRRAAEILVPIAQRADTAALVYNDSQLMESVRADGLHFDGSQDDFVFATAKAEARCSILGVGNITTRHQAMMMGEGPVDYLFFGRLNGDTKSDILQNIFKLAEWWCSLFEIPGIVMGGHCVSSVTKAAQAGIDFVMLRNAIWNAPDPKAACIEANKILDQDYLQKYSSSSGQTSL